MMKYVVKQGCGIIDNMMTVEQAKRYGDRNMPEYLKSAGFETVIFQSDPEIHGGSWLRINYAKQKAR